MSSSCFSAQGGGWSSAKTERRLRTTAGSGLVWAVLALMFCTWPFRALAAAPNEHYSGVMTLPIDLFTEQAVKLESGKYQIVVTPQGIHWTLTFLPPNQQRIDVKGNIAAGDLFILPATVPLVGTHHLRSSAEPMKTAQERQHSKTGLPQYAEEERRWDATIRAYRNSADPSNAFFVFHVRGPGRKLVRVDFKLWTEAPRANR